MEDNFDFQNFKDEAEDDGILPDEDETEDDELAGSGMHIEGADADEEDEAPMESDM